MCPFNKLISKKHLDSTRFFSCMNQCCKFNVLWWKSKKTGTFSGRAWLQNVCGGGSRGECPWQCRCGWRYWQDEGLLPPIEKDAGGRRIQRTEIGRYRTPKARCGVYRCSPSGRVSEEILRAATPMYCGALFLLVGKLSKNCHWSRVLFRYEAMVQLAFCRLMYNKLCDWNLNSFLLWHAMSVLSFALKLYAL